MTDIAMSDIAMSDTVMPDTAMANGSSCCLRRVPPHWPDG